MGACSNPQRPSISSRLRPNSVAPLIQRTYTMVWGSTTSFRAQMYTLNESLSTVTNCPF